MIKIKICGITNFEDAKMVVDSGADAIGFIFVPSNRMVTPQLARSITVKLPPFITTVGVFMDTPLNRVNEILRYTKINVAQLHGDETPEYCNLIECSGIIKRINIDGHTSLNNMVKHIKQYKVSGFLFDPGKGSGKEFDWKKIKGIRDYANNLIIAGGLTPENVNQAIKIIRPYGVDVCTGVERAPGKKDPVKVKLFINEVKLCSLPA